MSYHGGLIGVAPMGVEVSLDMQTLLDARTVRGVIEGDCKIRLNVPVSVPGVSSL